VAKRFTERRFGPERSPDGRGIMLLLEQLFNKAFRLRTHRLGFPPRLITIG